MSTGLVTKWKLKTRNRIKGQAKTHYPLSPAESRSKRKKRGERTSSSSLSSSELSLSLMWIPNPSLLLLPHTPQPTFFFWHFSTHTSYYSATSQPAINDASSSLLHFHFHSPPLPLLFHTYRSYKTSKSHSPSPTPFSWLRRSPRHKVKEKILSLSL